MLVIVCPDQKNSVISLIIIIIIYFTVLSISYTYYIMIIGEFVRLFKTDNMTKAIEIKTVRRRKKQDTGEEGMKKIKQNKQPVGVNNDLKFSGELYMNGM